MTKAIKKLAVITILSMSLIIGNALSAAEIPALRDAESPEERARIQKLIDGAKSEGKLEWLGVMIEPPHARYLIPKFKEYYGLTDLDVEYSFSPSSAVVTRIEQLLKAKKNNFDIVWTSAWAWYKSLLDRKAIMKYDSPKYEEYTLSKKLGLSVPGYWVCDGYVMSPIYDPKAVAAALGVNEFKPTSWWDFTDPKLKGLVAMGNIAKSTSYSATSVALEKKLGKEYFMKLRDNVKPTMYRKTSHGRKYVISGEFPIALFIQAKQVPEVHKAGKPCEILYPKEGVLLLPFAPIIMADAPHPNAAKLFIDYVRSEVGTNEIMKAGALLFFGRPGVKSTVSPDLLPPLEKLNVIPFDWDKDGTAEAIQDIQKRCKDSGLCY